MRNRCVALLLLLFFSIANSFAQTRWFENGKWVKLNFDQTGVYKITYENIESWGLNPSQINLDYYHLLGIQGNILSSINPDSVISQTEEIPMMIEKGQDNKWGPGDYFLLYITGTKGFLNTSSNVLHYKNFYTAKTHAIFGYNAEVGKRVNQFESSETPSRIVDKSVWINVHDSDIVNLNGMGRVWMGERLGNETLNRNFNFIVPSGLDSVEVQITTGSAIEESNATLYTILNGKGDTLNLSPLNVGSYDKYKYHNRNYFVPIENQRLDVSFKLARPNSKSSVYIDYIKIVGRKRIEFKGDPLLIMDNHWVNSTETFLIKAQNSTGKNLRFWNVSNNLIPEEWKISQSGSECQVVLPSNANKTAFILFDETVARTPNFMETLNTKSIFSSNDIPDILIISHESLLSAANKLAELRRSQSQKVKVVTPQEIYNEFSGGQADLIAIRRCIRWMKHESDKSNANFRYVTIMGSASYDMLDRISNNTNRVPIYQSFGHSPAVIFCLDEYITYTEARQGDPEISRSDKLGVSVGRIPARTLDEANGFVDKLIRYDSKKSLGPWRNNIVFTSDDADQVWETEFVYQSEEYSKHINKNNPSARIHKVYADAFKQVVNGNSERYPDFANTFNSRVSEGSLFINYQGHGGEKGLGQESLLDIPTIKSWKNEYRMPVLFTATCEFTKYDDPNFQSAGELAVLNPNGGAIASLTTTRLVYVPTNSAINRAFWTQYGFPGPNDPIPTVGDVFQKLKNRPNKTDDDKKFALMGDASMKLAFPEHLIALDSVQGQDFNAFKDTLKAFEIVTIKGHIQERGKGLMGDFNGNLWVTIFDKPNSQFTLDNDNNGAKINFEEQNSVIFNGQVSVKDGLFTVIFVVPKDISYQVGIGKAIFYAHNNITDATGGWNFLLGSSLKLQQIDTLGPTVRAYLQDTSFIRGSTVSKNVDFVARIFDENGINATGSGIGRDMVLVIDEGTEFEKTIVVNQYFQYDVNSFKNGTLTVPLIDLIPGRHTFRCKVWDIFNNFGSDETVGIVTPGRQLKINDHGVSPNPLTDASKIWFSHSLPGEDLKIEWQIIDQKGDKMGQGDIFIEASFANSVINLDGILPKSNSIFNQQNFSQGIYFYKLFISTSDGLHTAIGGKFVFNPNN